MDNRALARLVAAYAVLGTRGISRDRICVDENAVPYVDGKFLSTEWLTRITMFSLILLDAIEHDYEDLERDVIEKFESDRLSNTHFKWLRAHFDQGRISVPLSEFLEAA